VVARIVAGRANPELAGRIAAALASTLVPVQLETFPDGELRPVVGEVRGEDVYLVQPTGPPVSENLVELLLLLDGCRRAGADRVTAVVPYFGYARQDRRGAPGEAVGARMAADVITAAGADRIIVVDPHTLALEAMFSVPVEMLSAVTLLAGAVRPALPEGTVVIAPDLGALKLARRFSAALGMSFGVVSKHRLSGATVRAEELVGDVAGRSVLIVDDMISTGATIEAAMSVVRAHGAEPDVTVAASHGLFVGPAAQRLQHPGLRRLVITDSILHREDLGLPLATESIASLLADAIDRLHNSQPLDGLLIPT
jgi:ribose-phosphate pyrophosphokinase